VSVVCGLACGGERGESDVLTNGGRCEVTATHGGGYAFVVDVALVQW
jgi:hypothetical protein